MELTRIEFEKIVDEGIAMIPEKFLRLLENVAVVIEDEPTSEQRKKLKLHRGWTLYGLYQGTPQLSRGSHYTWVLPDKITIFKKPIEDAARDMQDLKEIVRDTVWHEIAHHFGMDESEVRRAEEKRKNKKRLPGEQRPAS